MERDHIFIHPLAGTKYRKEKRTQTTLNIDILVSHSVRKTCRLEVQLHYTEQKDARSNDGQFEHIKFKSIRGI